MITVDDDAIRWLGRHLAGPRDPLDPRLPWTRERVDWLVARVYVHECGLPLALDDECRLFCRGCRAALLDP